MRRSGNIAWLRPQQTAVLAAALCMMFGSSACRSGQRATMQAMAETEEGRFPHAKHEDTSCVDCHSLSAVLAGEPAVPGADDHAPCDQHQCHQKEFLRPPGKLCELCHLRVDPATPESAAPAPYPPERGPRALASEFSHAGHLDFAAMESQVGFHVTCSDCHTFDDRAKLLRPGHAVCERCHAPGAAPLEAPAMHDCRGCHRKRAKKPTRVRRLIVGDLHFRHGNHRTDRTGKQIRCRECHETSASVEEPGAHAPPTTRACVSCHDDVDRTPSALRMRSCDTCHASRSGGFHKIAPRTHLPAPDRPEDHTLAFRRDHSADATLHGERCARCHTSMSGSRRDTCDDCHQVMRPHDHVITWREYDHGPAAATRTDRCVTCHRGEFCTACHSRPPRSHYPRLEFRNGAHGALAAYDYRACVTCHVVDRDCVSAGCHTMRSSR